MATRRDTPAAASSGSPLPPAQPRMATDEGAAVERRRRPAHFGRNERRLRHVGQGHVGFIVGERCVEPGRRVGHVDSVCSMGGLAVPMAGSTSVWSPLSFTRYRRCKSAD